MNIPARLRQEKLILEVFESFAKAQKDAGMSQADLARKLGVSRSRVSYLLNGGNITLRTVADISAALGIRPSFVMKREQE